MGPANGYGFSRSHEIGRQYVEQELAISTDYEEFVAPVDAGEVIETMIASGFETIVTAARDFDQAALDSATAHPELTFLQFEGKVSADNLVSYSARMYQALWLAGLVAGTQTETEYVGIVTTAPNPDTVRHINAFTLGVLEVRPQATVEVVWVMSVNDPPVEADLTEELLARGADVILSQTGTPTAIQVADGLAWTIGYHNADACTNGPLTCLTSAYWNWGPLYTDLLTQRAAGHLQGGPLRWEPLVRDTDVSPVALADFSVEVEPEVGAALEDGLAEIEAGPVALPFIGPLRDVNGQPHIVPGEPMADDLLLGICWLVEGVSSWDPVAGALVPAVLPAPCPPPPPPVR